MASGKFGVCPSTRSDISRVPHCSLIPRLPDLPKRCKPPARSARIYAYHGQPLAQPRESTLTTVANRSRLIHLLETPPGSGLQCRGRHSTVPTKAKSFRKDSLWQNPCPCNDDAIPYVFHSASKTTSTRVGYSFGLSETLACTFTCSDGDVSLSILRGSQALRALGVPRKHGKLPQGDVPILFLHTFYIGFHVLRSGTQSSLSSAFFSAILTYSSSTSILPSNYIPDSVAARCSDASMALYPSKMTTFRLSTHFSMNHHRWTQSWIPLCIHIAARDHLPHSYQPCTQHGAAGPYWYR